MKQLWFPALAGLGVSVALLSGCRGDSTPPGRVTDLTFVWDAESLTRVKGRLEVVNPTPPVDTRTLVWTAPGGDGDQGKATEFDVRYFSQTLLTEKGWTPEQGLHDHFDDAKQLHHEPSPFPADEAERWFLPRLDVSETYYFALLAKDQVGNASKISNIAGPVQLSLLAISLPGASGPEPGLGAAVADAKNFIGNHFPDLVAGSPLMDQALIYEGVSTRNLLEIIGAPGLHVKKAKAELPPVYTLTGHPGEQFGAAVAGIGKFVHAFHADLAIGAPAAASGAGRVYLFYGNEVPAGSVTADQAAAVLTGDTAGDRFGAVVAALGDVNQDTFADFAVSAPGAGKVYVFLGGDTVSKFGRLPSGKASAEASVILVGDTVEKFGAALAQAGDLNGDGYQDIVIGSPAAVYPRTLVAGGAAYVFYGGNAGHIRFLEKLKHRSDQVVVDVAAGETVDVAIYGETAGSGFGSAVAGSGQLLKRTLAETKTARDLAVGAPGVGQVDVFYGGTVLFHPPRDHFEPVPGTDANRSVLLQGDTASGFGTSVILPGDINLDHFGDLVVGLPGLEAVRIYFWNDGPPANFHQLQLSATPGSGFGAALAPAGDLNKDGYADLIIGAPLAGVAYFEF